MSSEIEKQLSELQSQYTSLDYKVAQLSDSLSKISSEVPTEKPPVKVSEDAKMLMVITMIANIAMVASLALFMGCPANSGSGCEVGRQWLKWLLGIGLGCVVGYVVHQSLFFGLCCLVLTVASILISYVCADPSQVLKPLLLLFVAFCVGIVIFVLAAATWSVKAATLYLALAGLAYTAAGYTFPYEELSKLDPH